jgi:Phage tail lysozyme
VRSGSPAAQRKNRKIRKAGRHCAPWTAQKSVRRLGLIAPAFVVLGAVGAWQLSPFDSGPATAGSAQRAELTARYLPPPLTGEAKTFLSKALTRNAPEDADAVADQHQTAARPAAKASPAAKPGAASPKPKPAATPAASHPAPAPSPKAFACAGTIATGMLPENYGPIVTFLAAHGYTPMAAAGIAGNIYQESQGNPESVGTGGGGLIGWTPLPAGFVTGNPQADLQTQLTALLAFNQQWAQYIPMLNAATSPTEAADVYMNYFERPGLPAAYNREGAASAVAQACGIS